MTASLKLDKYYGTIGLILRLWSTKFSYYTWWDFMVLISTLFELDFESRVVKFMEINRLKCTIQTFFKLQILKIDFDLGPYMLSWMIFLLEINLLFIFVVTSVISFLDPIVLTSLNDWTVGAKIIVHLIFPRHWWFCK